MVTGPLARCSRHCPLRPIQLFLFLQLLPVRLLPLFSPCLSHLLSPAPSFLAPSLLLSINLFFHAFTLCPPHSQGWVHCDGNGQQHWTWESSEVLLSEAPLGGCWRWRASSGWQSGPASLPLGFLCHPFFLEAWVGHMETGEPAGQGEPDSPTPSLISAGVGGRRAGSG